MIDTAEEERAPTQARPMFPDSPRSADNQGVPRRENSARSNRSGKTSEQDGEDDPPPKSEWCCFMPDDAPEGFDEHKALDNVWWCCYCCCVGWGGSDVRTRPFLDCKCCCCSEQCKQVPCNSQDDGCWNFQHICCCCMYAAQLPRRPYAPECMLCNMNVKDTCCCTHSSMMAQRSSAKGGEEGLHENVHDVLLEHFLCCYMCCTGVGCAPGVLALLRTQTKCCCCNMKSGLRLPNCGEDSIHYGWCGHYLALWKVYSQCKVPFFYSETPCLACFGRRCHKVK